MTWSHLARIAPIAGVLLSLSCTSTVEVPDPVLYGLEIGAGGTPLTQAVNTFVATVPSVRVMDGAGTPVAGARVVFTVTRGAGTVGTAEVLTDANGSASPGTWRYGTRSGPQQLAAALVSATADAHVSFDGSALPGPTATIGVSPEAIALRPAGTRTIIASTMDAFGNPTAGGPTATFTSLDTAVASVSSAGLVTAVAPGTTIIRVSVGAVLRDVSVIVGDRPSGVDVTTVNVSDGPWSAAVRADGLIYVARGISTALLRFQLPSMTVQGSINSGSGRTSDVTFVPGKDRAYSANVDLGTVSVINTTTHTLDHAVSIGSEMLRVRADAAGTYVYATTIGGGVKRINTTNDAVSTVSVPGFLNGLALNEARGVLYATSMEGMLYEIALSTFTLVRSLSLGGSGGLGQGVAVTPDGSAFFVALEGAGVRRFDATTFASGAIFGPSTAFDVAVTTDGTDLYIAAAAQNQVAVHLVATGALVRTHDIGSPRRLSFTTDGLTAIVASEAGAVVFIR